MRLVPHMGNYCLHVGVEGKEVQPAAVDNV